MFLWRNKKYNNIVYDSMARFGNEGENLLLQYNYVGSLQTSLTYIYQVDFSTITPWTSPISIQTVCD